MIEKELLEKYADAEIETGIVKYDVTDNTDHTVAEAFLHLCLMLMNLFLFHLSCPPIQVR